MYSGALTARPGQLPRRWEASAAELGGRLAVVTGDALLAAAAVNYLGAFTGVRGCGGALPVADPPAGLPPQPGSLLSIIDRDPTVGPPNLHSGPYRAQLGSTWAASCAALGIPASPEFSLPSTLSNAVELLELRSQGLPADTVGSGPGGRGCLCGMRLVLLGTNAVVSRG
jgi:hypothetical protein